MATPLPKYGTSDSGDKNLLENQQSTGGSSGNTLWKLITSFAVQAHVISEANSPPGGEVESDVHLVGSVPAGAWAAFDAGDLAIFIDAGWYELDPFDGLTIIREDQNNAQYSHDGTSWLESPSSAAAAIAAAGTTQGTATALTARVNEVTGGTVSTADGVQLPAAAPGLHVVVIIETGFSVDVFPATGDDINGGAVNTAETLADGNVASYWAVDATSWYSQLS